MSKIDLSIDRSITLNAGNYNSIKPTIGITIKDVDQTKASDAYIKISNMLDALLAKEVIRLYDEMYDIDKIGLKNYVMELKKQEETIDGAIKSFGNK